MTTISPLSQSSQHSEDQNQYYIHTAVISYKNLYKIITIIISFDIQGIYLHASITNHFSYNDTIQS